MFEPTNEQGTIALFCTQLQRSGWEIVSIRTAFPDAILRRDGEEWRVEFEHLARNFIMHAHDFRECDLIICWQNNFAECPIPVLELSDPAWVDIVPQKGNPLIAQIEYWRARALKAEERAARAEGEIMRKHDAAKPERKASNATIKYEPYEIEKLIVRFLKAKPGAKLDDIAAHVDTTKGNVSKKITSLVEMGVLHEERQGNRRVVTVNGNHEQFLAN